MGISMEFDNPKVEYYPETVISGVVNVHLKESKKITKIAIKFKGVIDTHWSKRHTRRVNGKSEQYTVYYKGNTTLFDNGIILVGGAEDFKLQPGEYSYRFQFLLPPNLPVNYEGRHGSIRYTVKAFVDIPWGIDISTKQEFRIIPVVNLNIVSRAHQRFLIEKQKSVGFCCCASGNILFTIAAPRCGYICSEVIPFHVEIQNNSGAEIYETEIQIKKKIIYIATSPSYSQETESDTLVSRTWPTEIPPRGGQRILQAPVPLILTEPSTIDETLLIRITYEVEVTCRLRGMHCNINKTLPIVIGNIPMNTYGNNVAPPSMMIPNLPTQSYYEQKQPFIPAAPMNSTVGYEQIQPYVPNAPYSIDYEEKQPFVPTAPLNSSIDYEEKQPFVPNAPTNSIDYPEKQPFVPNAPTNSIDYQEKQPFVPNAPTNSIDYPEKQPFVPNAPTNSIDYPEKQPFVPNAPTNSIDYPEKQPGGPTAPVGSTVVDLQDQSIGSDEPVQIGWKQQFHNF